MRFPLTDEIVADAARFALRSACGDCFHFVAGACAHGWPLEGQERSPIDAPEPDGSRPREIVLCREFELR